MQIKNLEDGSGVLLTNNLGEKMKISHMEYWEIVKDGNRKDTMQEAQEYLDGCFDIEGMDADDIRSNESLMKEIVEKTISKRRDNENGDQVWDAAAECVREYLEKESSSIDEMIEDAKEKQVANVEKGVLKKLLER